MPPLPALFVTHGAGPCFFCPEFDDTMQLGPKSKYAEALRSTQKRLGVKPACLVVVSAHWEASGANTIAVSSVDRTSMLYDYGGFPKHTYELKYPAAGSPTVARRVAELLEGNGLRATLDKERGIDHGVFIPLMLMFPDADIPVVAVSINSHLEPELHLKLGEALAPLREEGVLLVGSGSSIHGRISSAEAREFNEWLVRVATDPSISPAERRQLLAESHRAPHFQKAHPRAEHYVPLLVAAGANGFKPGVVDVKEPSNLFARGLDLYCFAFHS